MASNQSSQKNQKENCVSLKNKIAGTRAILYFDNWPGLLLGRLMYRGTGLFVYRKNGLEILVDHLGGDEVGTRECIVGEMYRKYIPRFRFKHGIRLLDIGANGGGFPLMLKLAGIDLRQTVCVEMNPLTCSRLQLNLQTNLGISAVALNAAVCRTKTEGEIHLTPCRGGTSYSMEKDKTDVSSGVSVKTTSLQALYDHYFCDGPIDICKIDIEGAEYEVFDSSDDDLLRKIKYLIVEFHTAQRTPAVVGRLLTLGFSEITDQLNPDGGAKTEVRCFCGAAAEDSFGTPFQTGGPNPDSRISAA